MNPLSNETPDEVFVGATRGWLEKEVIGLNLCPFAREVHAANRIRYVVSRARSGEALRADLVSELKLLDSLDPAQVDTTLLIHPYVLGDFLTFNDFLDVADAALEELGYVGTFQIASFHPCYQFADTEPDDVTNRSNQSPYPTLHLLREDSVEKAVANYPEVEKISERNIETLRRLGAAQPPESGPAKDQAPFGH